MLLKIDSGGQIDWTLKFVNTSHPDKPASKGNNLIKVDENTFILHYMEVSNFSSSGEDQSWARHKFLTMDIDGNILDSKQFQDGQYCFSFHGSFFDKDTTYLQYYNSKLFGSPPNNDYFKYMPVLSRLDESMDTVWRIRLSDVWHNAVSSYSSIQKIRKINSTTFVAAYQHSEEIEANSLYQHNVRILNFSSAGNINWRRDYYYYNIDLFNDPEYEIKDLEIMPDNGFIMGGQVFNYDFFNDNEPSQFAYLLRTNCLGFLSPPQAQFSYIIDENEVVITNSSMNAGSYTYYFGDGDTLNTNEDVDSVMHTYDNESEYEITLIAHGCNGESDTVQLQVKIELEEETYGNIGDNYFTLYPNPVQQGKLISVETGNVENAQLHFYDSQGRLVKTVPLPSAKSIYFIKHNFAAGEYLIQLTSKSQILEHKKMVVL